MIGKQNTLPGLQKYMEQTARAVGMAGELYAAVALEKQGFEVSFTHPGEQRGDLRVVDPKTGVVWHIEVKTARRGKRGWQFILRKDDKAGKTDCRHADFVILLAVMKSGRNVPFIIPVHEIGEQQKITITSHPDVYEGKWAAYRRKEVTL